MTDHGYTPDVTLHMGAVAAVARKLKEKGACMCWSLEETIQCGAVEAHIALTRWYNPERARVSTFLYSVLGRRIIREYALEHGLATTKHSKRRPQHFPLTDVGVWSRDGDRYVPEMCGQSREQDPLDALMEQERRDLADSALRMAIGAISTEQSRRIATEHLLLGMSQTEVAERHGVTRGAVSEASRKAKQMAHEAMAKLEVVR